MTATFVAFQTPAANTVQGLCVYRRFHTYLQSIYLRSIFWDLSYYVKHHKPQTFDQVFLKVRPTTVLLPIMVALNMDFGPTIP
ncbi:hypothetical protein GDO81_004783 [Engystomops pustulosus]|uniref:Uncharacterized protein n=1 Tax=Engystomops pustulosus TaxID=76066 RepID=A0AAV7CL51_ENGPU|nr:hypothetical protein GDO81_004783 [Engystomops pustulosus]